MKVRLEQREQSGMIATNMSPGDFGIVLQPEHYKGCVLYRLDARDESGHTMWAIFGSNDPGDYGDHVWAGTITIRPITTGERVVIEV